VVEGSSSDGTRISGVPTTRRGPDGEETVRRDRCRGVLEDWHAGRPKSVIAASFGLDAKTVRRYVAPAEAAGIVPGGPPLDRAGWAELVRRWFPGLVVGTHQRGDLGEA
jgi:hypothetical protein